jgi:steroid delta-isomerase-like uncharacterized protein
MVVSASRDKDLFRKFPEEVVAKGRFELIPEIFSEDIIYRVPVSPEPFRGHEGVEQIVTAFRTAFPDISATIEEITQEEDRIVMQALIRGTNEGELMGTPPTGRSATWRVVHLGRIAGGKIVEDTVVFDQLGLLRQLGLAPVPEAARA